MRWSAFALVLSSILLALAPSAFAQQVHATRCAAPWSSSATHPTGPLAANGGYLLTRDGSGFFTDTLQTIAIRSAHIDQESVAVTTEAIAQDLTNFYFGSNVEVFVNLPGKSTRAVMIDGDTAVPGQPTVFTIGGVPTLFLHWTTAEADIADLLDEPTFMALGSIESVGCQATAMSSTAVDIKDGATGFKNDPSNVLAYVDDDSAIQAPPLSLPFADSVPNAQWPLGVSAAAILVAAGGVVLHRRDKLWEDRYAPDHMPAAQLIEASKPRFPTADLPPAVPRVIVLDEHTGAVRTESTPAAKRPPAQRQIELHAKSVESPLTSIMEEVSSLTEGPVLPREDFAHLVNLEWSRHRSGGSNGAVASLVLSELGAVRARLGDQAAEDLFDEVAVAIADLCRPLDVVGLADDDELAILMPDLDESGAHEVLDEITKKITATTFSVGGDRVLLTPATGFAMLSDTKSSPELIRAVESARALAMMNLHLDPERWAEDASGAHDPKAKGESRWHKIKDKLRTPAQIAITFVIAWVIPFFAYLGMDAIGMDISFIIYLIVVASLVMTGAFILAEGVMAVKQKEPPEVPSTPYPKATALIAAYMPNEAATVIETVDAFLAMDYPAELQIILAYNTPDPMPIEDELDRIAAEHPNFVPVRIIGSTSKAQNVNAALTMAEGEFIGMFDADHQPRPDAFTRAWRWIDAGYDVVQGHCLTRNGDESFLAKMIAVEFESIYAVAHPGRAKMHRFGVFGGSNGFWRTELLHETRMRGSMLTEDIDSSMRVVERGFKIRSDRDLVSRELATTTFKQIWNQRMRWAQGWFQVSLEHMKFAFKAKELTIRQKLGIFHLMMWREFYPWLSQQLFPLVGFWALRAGGVGELDWTIPVFVATSIFTFSVGPLQVVYAYRLADPEIKQHKKWFWAYLLFTTPFYTEYKNLIARVAHIKQFMGESEWRVTPRSADPVPELAA